MGADNRTVVGACWRISLFFFVGFSSFVWAATSLVPSDQTNELHIKPNTCVSLHQGQTCFVNLTISWNMANSNDYCLYSSAQPTPIKCWIASNQGVITQDFSAEQTLHFYLKLDKSNTVVAESELSISWVYKKQQKSRLTWRLF